MAERSGGRPGTVMAVMGATGSGKSAVAVELALLLGTSVISCDSMQVYAGFPVLTNQPPAEALARVRHELVGCIEPERPFSAAEYAGVAQPLIERSLGAHGWALLAGGTGLYMRAALAPLAMRGRGDPARRRALEARAEREGAEALHRELAERDPEAARAIDRRNVRRVVRALEALDEGGETWSGRADLWEPAYEHPTVVAVLRVDREELRRRIDTRSEAIVRGGAVDEVRRFREERGAAGSSPGGAGIRSAIGYREICRYLDGEQALEETIAQVAAATRGYARRQVTWLSKVKGAVIIETKDRPSAEVAADIADLARAG